MMHKEIPFKNVTILNKHFFSLGTPDQVKEYEYALLFDLDGTLVNTDHIYTEVWDTIFKKYKFNYTINTDFFNNFIKGKNDSLFLNYLLPNIDQLTMSHISQLKDELFIKLLQTNTDNLLSSILLPGVLDFFQRNKNRKIAIVTSCNRKSAEYIIEYTGLTNYISLLIASDDCTRHKPDPEPYLKAIEQLNLNKAKTIIFEDSYSGYTSAKNAQVGKIVLICNDNSCLDIKTANEYKIPDYRAFNINMLPLLACENPINSISVRIKTELLKILPVKEVISSTVQLKTGYICDIQAYTMVFNANHSENIVLKINNTENELSKTAEKMNLYNNEIHFYKHLCDSLGQYIHIPKCYGIVPYDDTYTRTGIILENLFKYEGTFNLDLNKDIQCLLGVVSEIAKLHHIYYFKNEEDVPLNMRQVTTMNNLVFFKELLNERFDTFVEKNKLVLKTSELEIMHKCFKNYQQNVLQVSTYPLSFCHGDLKSANIFYREPNKTPYFLDWQYTNLNKGVSDIVFLLVESIKFDKVKVDLVVNYYYSLMKENIKCDTYTYDEYTYDEYMNDFKACLGIFPFVVCVWFNSENNDKLLDKIFPVKFMKNLVEYYNYFM
jgi:HAD superfamily hydrolase (TIGR01509 family)